MVRRWAATLLLLLAFGLMTGSAVRKSPTVDEQSHLFRGVAYLQTGATHFRLGHPILGGLLAALPLLTEPGLELPVEDPSWEAGDWSVAGDLFLWQINTSPLRLVFLSRLPVIFLTLLLGALAFRWGREMGGERAGLLAILLLLFDPNILAHGRLVTGDLQMSAFFVLALYGYWRWTANEQVRWLVLAGIGLGLAGATKFNAALLVPVLGLLGIGLALRRKSWRPLLALALVGLVGWSVIWAVHGFALRPLPGGAFWEDLLWELRYFDKPHGAYLTGRYSAEGWWFYFPVAYAVKTPLPTLALLLWATLATVADFNSRLRRGAARGTHVRGVDLLFLLLPAGLYTAVSLTSKLNIGFRYLLPVLPFLALFVAVRLSSLRLTAVPQLHRIPDLLAVCVLVGAVLVWPDYLSFFNLAAGGRSDGWRILSDSNVDWGQDLPALAGWQAETGEPVKLSYFGMAHPSAYGIRFESLPTWQPAPEQKVAARQAFYPPDPAPGWYAISVTNLHGAVLGEGRETFAWFRDRQPVVRLGGSIFVYQVESHGPPVQLALSGLVPAEMDPALVVWESNELHIRWFDERTSFVWPAGESWAAVRPQEPADRALVERPAAAAATSAGQLLFSLTDSPRLQLDEVGLEMGGVVRLLGFRPVDSSPGEIAVVTGWQVLSPTGLPLHIFVHALDGQGAIAGQWDGLDVDPVGWQEGDRFVQVHRFAVDDQAQVVGLAVGMYDRVTMGRLSGAPAFVGWPPMGTFRP